MKTGVMIGSVCFLLLLFFSETIAQVKLPVLIRDSMVLQRDETIMIYGWASPGEKISLDFNRKKFSTKASASGDWQIALPAMKAGGPYTMEIRGRNHLSLKDILVGDVFLCAGQSNMVHQLRLHRFRYAKEIREANNPMIRHFTVPNTALLNGPANNLPSGNWISANPKDVMEFSAVAYFFALELYEKYKVPIGLINASVGGTPIEAWMSEDAVKNFPVTYSILEKNKDSAYVNQLARNAAARNALLPPVQDEGMNETAKWYDDNYKATGWDEIMVPGFWEDQGFKNMDGIVWFKKTISLTKEFISLPTLLSLGRIVDAEEVYVNGKQVGRTTYQYPQRRFELAANSLREGKNTITVRITNYNGKGGWVPGKPYFLANEKDTIDLEGKWQYKIGDVFETNMQWQGGLNAANQPAALFNGMIAPLQSFPVKAALWYQGESNTHNADQYGKLLRSLITDWRKLWRKEIPFLFVQLPNFNEKEFGLAESSWAKLRDEQRKTLEVQGTAMAVAIDLGEWNDIHPGNKKDVGSRLALAAKSLVYGEKNLVSSGPLFKEAKQEGNKIEISFSSTGSALVTNDGRPPGSVFIAGADRKFLRATTSIENNKLLAWHPNLRVPVYIRYAWADNPANANLYNKEGLPASPFEAEVNSSSAFNRDLPWKGKKAAVVLTYDDALNVHLSNAIPALDAAGLRGTFYLSDYFGGLQAQLKGWRAAALRGHELANHTMFHPCDGSLPGRNWVTADYDLSKYSMRRINDEISAMNNLLFSLDGKSKRTFAFPCADTKIKGVPYLDTKHGFAAARNVRHEMVPITTVRLDDLPSYGINGEGSEKLIALVREAIEKRSLLIFLFHGVGGEHSLDVSLEAHQALINFLKEHQDEIWVAPVVEVAEYVKAYQDKSTNKN